jgi:hypothetical protein
VQLGNRALALARNAHALAAHIALFIPVAQLSDQRPVAQQRVHCLADVMVTSR